MRSNFKFNGIRKDYCSYMNYESQYGLDRELEINSVKGRPGGVLNGISIKPREIEVTFLFDSHKVEGMTLNQVADDAVNWLTTDEPVEMIFDREPDKIYYAMLQGQLDVEGVIAYSKVTATFVCLDPYKYSTNTYTNTAISDQLAVHNKGNAPTPTVVTARALKSASSFMITKSDEDYFMIGDDDVEKVEQDYSPELYFTEMRNFTGWSKIATGSFSDKYLGGLVGGDFQLSSTGDAFVVKNWPTGTATWLGAATKHAFPRSAQDFTTTFKIRVTQKNFGATRAAQFIYDTNNRIIGSLGYENKYHNRKQGHIVMSLFKENGEQVRIYDYANSMKYAKIDNMIIYIRLMRVGQTFTCKSWKYDEKKDPSRQKPLDSNTKTWTDMGMFYQRPVSAISVYTAKYSAHDHMHTSILGSFNRELLSRPPGAKDKFIKQGDLIQIDMQNKSVTLNDEPILSEKTFGSDYFELNPGISEMFIMPEGVFDTTAVWKDRYQ